MPIKNAKVRFGLEEDHGQASLYDYATANNIPIGPPLEADGGVWDTNLVAALIREGRSIESAFTPSPTMPPDQTAEMVDQVAKANSEFVATHTGFVASPPENPEGDKVSQANKDFSEGVALNSIAHPAATSGEQSHEISEASLETIEIDVVGTPLTPEQKADKETEKLAADALAKTSVPEVTEEVK